MTSGPSLPIAVTLTPPPGGVFLSVVPSQAGGIISLGAHVARTPDAP
jgi:hypothetical protein